jgi:hypothetical protein
MSRPRDTFRYQSATGNTKSGRGVARYRTISDRHGALLVVVAIGIVLSIALWVF